MDGNDLSLYEEMPKNSHLKPKLVVTNSFYTCHSLGLGADKFSMGRVRLSVKTSMLSAHAKKLAKMI